jgi:hypothetical protein
LGLFLAYGLRLASNMALPGLPHLSGTDGTADIQVLLKEKGFPVSVSHSPSEPFYVSRARNENGEPVLRATVLAGGGYLALYYVDGAHFILERNGLKVWADWPDELTLEDACTYLFGPVLGLLLHLRGILPLHASAVSIDNQAIALVGPAGAGKSTTAAGFARLGYRVITDDVVALAERGGHFVIPPGYPRVNLWAESVRALFGAEDILPLISSTWDKRFMPLDPESEFEKSSQQLGAVYVLRNREPGLATPIIEELTRSEAFMSLLGNTYMNHLHDPDMRRREFEVLGRIVSQIPVRAVQPAADLNALLRLCQAIAADVRGSSPVLTITSPGDVVLSRSAEKGCV